MCCVSRFCGALTALLSPETEPCFLLGKNGKRKKRILKRVGNKTKCCIEEVLSVVKAEAKSTSTVRVRSTGRRNGWHSQPPLQSCSTTRL